MNIEILCNFYQPIRLPRYYLLIEWSMEIAEWNGSEYQLLICDRISSWWIIKTRNEIFVDLSCFANGQSRMHDF